MKRSARPGFTLIELLVVIGIILVLMSIIVIGLRHVNYTAARHETVAELKICEDMLKEYDNVNGLKEPDGVVVPINAEGAASTTPPPKLTLPQYPPQNKTGYTLPMYLDNSPESMNGQPQTALNMVDFGASSNPGQTDMGDKSGPPFGTRYSSNAVVWTQHVMYILLRDPKNRTAIAAVPAKRILEGQVLTQGAPPTPFPVDYSVVLDGWGNPIVYVPRGGMHVYMSPKDSNGNLQHFVVRSSGISVNQFLPVPGPNDRPFFASAGQDGSFTDAVATGTDYASDNIYSFQD